MASKTRSLKTRSLFRLKKSSTDLAEWSKHDEKASAYVDKGDVDKLRSLLIKKGVNPAKLNPQGHTSFHKAAGAGKTEVVRALLEHVVRVNALDGQGRTALHYACRNGQVTTAEVLLEAGSAPEAMDKDKQSALHNAAMSGNPECVRLLLNQHTGNLNQKDSEGKTALYYAVHKGSVGVAELLINNGAMVNMRDRERKTPLIMAAERGHAQVCSLLVNSGANVLRKDKKGHNANWYAVNFSHTEVEEILRNAPYRASWEDDVTSSEEESVPLSSIKRRKLERSRSEERVRPERAVHAAQAETMPGQRNTTIGVITAPLNGRPSSSSSEHNVSRHSDDDDEGYLVPMEEFVLRRTAPAPPEQEVPDRENLWLLTKTRPRPERFDEDTYRLLEEDRDVLEAELQRLAIENKRLTLKVNRLEDMPGTSPDGTKITDQAALIDRLEKEVFRLNTELDHERRRSNDLDRDVRKLREELDNTPSEGDASEDRRQVAMLTAKLMAVGQENKDLREHLEEAVSGQQVKPPESDRRQLAGLSQDAHQQEVNQLLDRISTLGDQNVDLHKKLAESIEDKAAIEAENSQFRERNITLIHFRDLMDYQLMRMSDYIRELQERNGVAVANESAQSAERRTRVDADLEVLRQGVDTLKKQVPHTGSENIAAEFDRMQGENKFLKQANKTLGKKNIDLQTSVEAVQRQINSFQELAVINENLMKENARLNDRVKDLAEELGNLRHAPPVVIDGPEQLVALNARLREEARDLAEDNERMRRQLGQVQEDIDSTMKRLPSVDEFVATKLKVENLKKENKLLKSASLGDDYAAVMEERDRLKLLLLTRALEANGEDGQDMKLRNLAEAKVDNEELRRENEALKAVIGEQEERVMPATVVTHTYAAPPSGGGSQMNDIKERRASTSSSSSDNTNTLQDELTALRHENATLRTIKRDKKKLAAENEQLKQMLMDKSLDARFVVEPDHITAVEVLQSKNRALKQELRALKAEGGEGAMVVKVEAPQQHAAPPAAAGGDGERDRLKLLLMDRALDTHSPEIDKLRKEHKHMKELLELQKPKDASLAEEDLRREGDRLKLLLMDRSLETTRVVHEAENPDRRGSLEDAQKERDQLKLLLMDKTFDIKYVVQETSSDVEILKQLQDRVHDLELQNDMLRNRPQESPIIVERQVNVHASPKRFEDDTKTREERDRLKLLLMDRALEPRHEPQDDRLLELLREENKVLKTEIAGLQARLKEPEVVFQKKIVIREDEETSKERDRLKLLLMDNALGVHHVIHERSANSDMIEALELEMKGAKKEKKVLKAQLSQSRHDHTELEGERDRLKLYLMDKALENASLDIVREQIRDLTRENKKLKYREPQVVVEKQVIVQQAPKTDDDDAVKERDLLKMLLMDNALSHREVFHEDPGHVDAMLTLLQENQALKLRVEQLNAREPEVVVRHETLVQATPLRDDSDVIKERDRLKLLLLDRSLEEKYVIVESPINSATLDALLLENRDLKAEIQRLRSIEPTVIVQKEVVVKEVPKGDDAELLRERERLKLLLMDRAFETRHIIDEVPANREMLVMLEAEIEKLKDRKPQVVVQREVVVKEVPRKDDDERARLRLLLMDNELKTKYAFHEIPANDEALNALRDEITALREKKEREVVQEPAIVVQREVHVHAAPKVVDEEGLHERERLKLLLMDRALETRYIINETPANLERLLLLEAEIKELQDREPKVVIQKEIVIKEVQKGDDEKLLQEREKLKLLLMDTAFDARYIISETPANLEALTLLEAEIEKLKSREPKVVVQKEIVLKEVPMADDGELRSDREKLKLLLMDKALESEYAASKAHAKIEAMRLLEDEMAKLKAIEPKVIIQKEIVIKEVPKGDDEELLRERARLKLLLMDKAFEARYIISETPANLESLMILEAEIEKLKTRKPDIVVQKEVVVKEVLKGDDEELLRERARLKLLLMDRELETRYIVHEVAANNEALSALRDEITALREKEREVVQEPAIVVQREVHVHAAPKLVDEEGLHERERLKLLLMDRALETRYIINETPANLERLVLLEAQIKELEDREPKVVIKKEIVIKEVQKGDDEKLLQEREKLKLLLMDTAFDARYIISETPANLEALTMLEAEIEKLKSREPKVVVQKEIVLKEVPMADDGELRSDREKLKLLLMDKALESEYAASKAHAKIEALRLLEDEMAKLKAIEPKVIIQKEIVIKEVPKGDDEELLRERARLKLLLMDKAFEARYIISETPANLESLMILEAEIEKLKARKPDIVVQKEVVVKEVVKGDDEELLRERARLKLLLMDRELETRYIVHEVAANNEALSALRDEITALREKEREVVQEPAIVVQREVHVHAAPKLVDEEGLHERERLKLLLMDRALETRYIINETPANLERLVLLEAQIKELQDREPKVVIQKEIVIKEVQKGDDEKLLQEREKLKLLLMDTAFDARYIISETPANLEALTLLEAEIEKLKSREPKVVVQKEIVLKEVPMADDGELRSDREKLKLLLMDKALESEYAASKAHAKIEALRLLEDEMAKLKAIEPKVIVQKEIVIKEVPKGDDEELLRERARLKLLLMDKAFEARYIISETPANLESLMILEAEIEKLKARKPDIVVQKEVVVKEVVKGDDEELLRERARLKLLLMDRELETRYIVHEVAANNEALSALRDEITALREKEREVVQEPAIVVQREVHVHAAPKLVDEEGLHERERLKLLLMDRALETRYIINETPANLERLVLLEAQIKELQDREPKVVIQKEIVIKEVQKGDDEKLLQEREKLKLLLMDTAFDARYIISETPANLEALTLLEAEIEKLKSREPKVVVQKEIVLKEVPMADDGELRSDREKLKLLLMDKALESEYAASKAHAKIEALRLLEDEMAKLKAIEPKVIVQKEIVIKEVPKGDDEELLRERARLKLLLMDKAFEARYIISETPANLESLMILEAEIEKLKARKPDIVVQKEVVVKEVVKGDDEELLRERARLKLLLMDRELETRYIVHEVAANNEAPSALRDEITALREKERELVKEPAIVVQREVHVHAAPARPHDNFECEKLKLLLMDRALADQGVSEHRAEREQAALLLMDKALESKYVLEDTDVETRLIALQRENKQLQNEADNLRSKAEAPVSRETESHEIMNERDRLRLLLMDRTMDEMDLQQLLHLRGLNESLQEENKALLAQLQERPIVAQDNATTRAAPDREEEVSEMKIQALLVRNSELEQNADDRDRLLQERSQILSENRDLMDELLKLKRVERVHFQQSSAHADREQLECEIYRLKLLLMDKHQYDKQQASWIDDREQLEATVVGLNAALNEQSKLLEGNVLSNEMLAQDIERLTFEIEKLLQEKLQIERECKEKQTEIDNLNNAVLMLDNENRARSREVTGLRQSIEKQDSSSESIEEDIVKPIETIKVEASRPLASANRESADLGSEKHALEKDLLLLKERVATLTMEKDDLTERNNMLVLDNRQLANSKKELLDDLKTASDVESQKDKVTQENSRLLREVAALRLTEEQLRGVVEEQERFDQGNKERIKEMIDSKNDIEKEIERLKSELHNKMDDQLSTDRSLNDQLSELKKENEELKSNISAFKSRVDALEEDLQDSNDLIDSITSQRNKFRDENLRLHSDLDDSHQLMEDLQRSVAREAEVYEEKVSLAHSDRDRLIDERETLLAKVAVLQKAFEEIQTGAQKPEAATEHLTREAKLKQECDRLRDDNNILLLDIVALKKALEERGPVIASSEIRLQESRDETGQDDLEHQREQNNVLLLEIASLRKQIEDGERELNDVVVDRNAQLMRVQEDKNLLLLQMEAFRKERKDAPVLEEEQLLDENERLIEEIFELKSEVECLKSALEQQTVKDVKQEAIPASSGITEQDKEYELTKEENNVLKTDLDKLRDIINNQSRLVSDVTLPTHAASVMQPPPRPSSPPPAREELDVVKLRGELLMSMDPAALKAFHVLEENEKLKNEDLPKLRQTIEKQKESIEKLQLDLTGSESLSEELEQLRQVNEKLVKEMPIVQEALEQETLQGQQLQQVPTIYVSDSGDESEQVQVLKEAFVSALTPEVQRNIEAVDEENSALRSQLEELTDLNERQKQKIDELEERLFDFDTFSQSQTSQMELQREEWEDNNDMLQDKLQSMKKDFEKRITKTLEEMDEVHEENDRLQTMNTKYDGEIKRLKERLARADEDGAREVEELLADRERLETEAVGLRRRVDELTEQLREQPVVAVIQEVGLQSAPPAVRHRGEDPLLEELRATVLETRDRAEVAEKERDRLIADQDVMRMKISSLSRVLQEKEDDDINRESEPLVKSFREEADDVESAEKNDLLKRIALLEAALDKKMKEKTAEADESYRRQVETGERAISELKEDKNVLALQVAALRKALEDQQLHDGKEGFLRENESLRSELEDLRRDRDLLDPRRAEGASTDVLSLVDKLDQEKEDKQQVIRASDLLKNQMDNLTFEKLQLLGEISDLHKKTRDLEKELDSKSEEAMYLQTENKDLREILTTVEASPRVPPDLLVNKLKDENVKLQKFIETLGNQVDRINLTAGASPRETEVRLLERQCAMLQRQLEITMASLEEERQRHKEVVFTYRTHLLASVQGNMDPDVKQALLHIVRLRED